MTKHAPAHEGSFDVFAVTCPALSTWLLNVKDLISFVKRDILLCGWPCFNGERYNNLIISDMYESTYCDVKIPRTLT